MECQLYIFDAVSSPRGFHWGVLSLHTVLHAIFLSLQSLQVVYKALLDDNADDLRDIIFYDDQISNFKLFKHVYGGTPLA